MYNNDNDWHCCGKFVCGIDTSVILLIIHLHKAKESIYLGIWIHFIWLMSYYNNINSQTTHTLFNVSHKRGDKSQGNCINKGKHSLLHISLFYFKIHYLFYFIYDFLIFYCSFFKWIHLSFNTHTHKSLVEKFHAIFLHSLVNYH